MQSDIQGPGSGGNHYGYWDRPSLSRHLWWGCSQRPHPGGRLCGGWGWGPRSLSGQLAGAQLPDLGGPDPLPPGQLCHSRLLALPSHGVQPHLQRLPPLCRYPLGPGVGGPPRLGRAVPTCRGQVLNLGPDHESPETGCCAWAGLGGAGPRDMGNQGEQHCLACPGATRVVLWAVDPGHQVRAAALRGTDGVCGHVPQIPRVHRVATFWLLPWVRAWAGVGRTGDSSVASDAPLLLVIDLFIHSLILFCNSRNILPMHLW